MKLYLFGFIDKISEVEKDQSITAFFTLKGSEEFLQDHFEGFPVMPGVLLLESLKQAATLIIGGWANGAAVYVGDEVRISTRRIAARIRIRLKQVKQHHEQQGDDHPEREVAAEIAHTSDPRL